jgi:formylglycine-generating enzyme required for sulfatase activity
MATFPVTRRQFDAWAHPGAKVPEVQLQRPAADIGWQQATEFCAWLAQQEGWCGYRPVLPSEAEWEYACRAGTDTDYCSGDGEAALREVGWFGGNSRGRTHDVGELQPNAWGLYDMHGNVWEWCRDPEQVQTDLATDLATNDPLELITAGRPVRGGSWSVPVRWCRSAHRFWVRPGCRVVSLGFRVCLLPGPSGQTG